MSSLGGCAVSEDGTGASGSDGMGGSGSDGTGASGSDGTGGLGSDGTGASGSDGTGGSGSYHIRRACGLLMPFKCTNSFRLASGIFSERASNEHCG